MQLDSCMLGNTLKTTFCGTGRVRPLSAGLRASTTPIALLGKLATMETKGQDVQAAF